MLSDDILVTRLERLHLHHTICSLSCPVLLAIGRIRELTQPMVGHGASDKRINVLLPHRSGSCMAEGRNEPPHAGTCAEPEPIGGDTEIIEGQ